MPIIPNWDHPPFPNDHPIEVVHKCVSFFYLPFTYKFLMIGKVKA